MAYGYGIAGHAMLGHQILHSRNGIGFSPISVSRYSPFIYGARDISVNMKTNYHMITIQRTPEQQQQLADALTAIARLNTLDLITLQELIHARIQQQTNEN